MKGVDRKKGECSPCFHLDVKKAYFFSAFKNILSICFIYSKSNRNNFELGLFQIKLY